MDRSKMKAALRRIKPIDSILKETDQSEEHTLKRTLGVVSIMAMGIGAIVGTGIFVLTGVAAALYAGPGLIISFVAAGVVSGLAAVCYAEFASVVPVAGSAYTYSYATLGELVAWIIGWDLILEYAVGAAAVSIGWSGYFTHRHWPSLLFSRTGRECEDTIVLIFFDPASMSLEFRLDNFCIGSIEWRDFDMRYVLPLCTSLAIDPL